MMKVGSVWVPISQGYLGQNQQIRIKVVQLVDELLRKVSKIFGKDNIVDM
jgi:hypothetical protein